MSLALKVEKSLLPNILVCFTDFDDTLAIAYPCRFIYFLYGPVLNDFLSQVSWKFIQLLHVPRSIFIHKFVGSTIAYSSIVANRWEENQRLILNPCIIRQSLTLFPLPSVHLVSRIFFNNFLICFQVADCYVCA